MALRKLRHVLTHPISRNVVALGWIQIATFIVPLVTLPYIARVLDPSEFGLVVFAQSFSLVLTIFIDWGFTYYGVRAVAAARDDPQELARVVARVRGAQLLLVGSSVFVAVGCLLAIPKLRENPAFLVLAWVAAVGSGLATNWYFIGVERPRFISVLQLTLRAIGAGLTFLLVHRSGQGWIVLALFAASSLAMWLSLDFLMYREVPFRLPPWRASVDAVRGAGTFFMGTVAATMYTTFNVVLLGFFVTSTEVAHFGAAERLVRTSLSVIGPIGAAVYPRLVYLQSSERPHRAKRLLGIAVVIVGTIAVAIAAVLAIFAPTIIHIVYGPKYIDPSTPILRVLVLIIPISILGAIGGTWLMTLHQERTVAVIVLRSGILNVVLGTVLTLSFGPQGMAWSVVAAETCAAVSCLWVVRRMDRTAEVPLLPSLRRRRRPPDDGPGAPGDHPGERHSGLTRPSLGDPVGDR